MNIQNLLFIAVIAIFVLALLLGFFIGLACVLVARPEPCNCDQTDDLVAVTDRLEALAYDLEAADPKPEPASPAPAAVETIESAVGAK